MPTSRPWLPLAAVGFTLVAWASAFVAIRHLGEEVPPGSLSLGRLLVAVLALGVMVRLSVPAVRRRVPTKREWPLIILGGVSWIGIYNVALNEAERRIDAGTAALIIQIGPIIVALLATFLFRERLTQWLLIGLGVGFAGVVIIGRSSSEGDNGDLVGVLLTALAAVTFAVGVVTQKKLLVGGMTALEMTFWFYVVGAVACLPWSVELVGVVRDATASDLMWIAYLGIVPSALAFVTWAYALSHSDAGKFALSTFLVPFITTLMAWLALGEVPPALAFVGGAMCIIGVLLTRRKPRTLEQVPEPAPGAAR
ncbi:DMT family transporter [Nocardioides alcanivorans]|uniref:DMT family transporter n=1 Tax=Nocardioides alcanivorans TaxID=2897352 RepID=UPI001F3912E6|nr:EamA family transporter [Nocardioides alcanivorans]